MFFSIAIHRYKKLNRIKNQILEFKYFKILFDHNKNENK